MTIRQATDTMTVMSVAVIISIISLATSILTLLSNLCRAWPRILVDASQDYSMRGNANAYGIRLWNAGREDITDVRLSSRSDGLSFPRTRVACIHPGDCAIIPVIRITRPDDGDRMPDLEGEEPSDVSALPDLTVSWRNPPLMIGRTRRRIRWRDMPRFHWDEPRHAPMSAIHWGPVRRIPNPHDRS